LVKIPIKISRGIYNEISDGLSLVTNQLTRTPRLGEIVGVSHNGVKKRCARIPGFKSGFFGQIKLFSIDHGDIFEHSLKDPIFELPKSLQDMPACVMYAHVVKFKDYGICESAMDFLKYHRGKIVKCRVVGKGQWGSGRAEMR
jgi:hypothetical protein